jgi:hypothetical protein
MVILGSTLLQRKSFGPTIPDDENQEEAFGRAKRGTNQKQDADLFSGFSPPMEKLTIIIGGNA